MTDWPSDRQLPSDILQAVVEHSLEGQQRLIVWLFIHFRGLVGPDRLNTCLLEFTAKLRDGFVPNKPVGLLRTMLFRRLHDRRRRERKEKAIRAEIAQPVFTTDEPSRKLLEREIQSAIRAAVFGELDAASRAVFLGRTGGLSFAKIASILRTRLKEPWTATRVRRAFVTVVEKLRARFGVAEDFSQVRAPTRHPVRPQG